MVEALANDQRREAVDPFRGMRYQLLCSIIAWLNLSDHDILVIEGAEDFDWISGRTATVSQIKDTASSGNLTLRNAYAIDAIKNFWLHCQRNPGTEITFQYITTAGIGTEKGSELDLSEAGIDVWQNIKVSPNTPESLANAEKLRSFYSGRSEMPSGFTAWVIEASADEFIRRIVLPVSWITAQEDGSKIQETIRAKLAELGHQLGMSPRDAVSAIGQLYLIRQAIATTKPGAARTKALLTAALTAVPIASANLVRRIVISLPDK